MLLSLYIKNFALIDEIKIEFHPQYNILTGETGAGKSIIMGALNLILGQRADLSSLSGKNDKCVIEAEFEIGKYDLKKVFDDENLDYDEHTLLRREITRQNKSRSFVNDTPVTLETLKRITSRLIDIHSQQETLQLNSETFRFNMLDAFHQNKNLLNQYTGLYAAYASAQKQLAIFKEEFQRASEEHDYKSFLLQELNAAALDSFSQSELENERNTLQHAEEIAQTLAATHAALSENESNIVSQLRAVSEQLKHLKNFTNTGEAFYDRVQSCLFELDDVAKEISRRQNQLQAEPERLAEVNALLDDFYRLLKKHKAQTAEELLSIQQNLSASVSKAEHGQDEIQKLEKTISQQHSALLQLGTELTKERKSSAEKIEKNAVAYLKQLGMPHAQFVVVFEKLTEPRFNGTDALQFLFSANKGHEPRELARVASGGEMSRLMLSLKAILASAVKLPTMIFDEIDSGISGEVAIKTANILSEMSRQHQLICITHLPQVAAKANRHFKVIKLVEKNITNTRVLMLNDDDKVREIAQMLAGEKPSEAALENAKQLMN